MKDRYTKNNTIPWLLTRLLFFLINNNIIVVITSITGIVILMVVESIDKGFISDEKLKDQ